MAGTDNLLEGELTRASTLPVIAVTMATSRQGEAVVRHLSKKGIYQVRAIVRDPSSNSSTKLASLANVKVVKGDLLNPKDLLKAFDGVYGIYGNTTPTKSFGMDRNYELKQGYNLIKAIKEISKYGYLKHFIFSSVCKGKKSFSKIPAPGHFLTKWELENYIHSIGLSKITTILRPASYFENFNSKLPGVQISEKFFPGVVKPNYPWQTLAVDDIGLWTAVAFHNPKKFKGESLNLAGEELTGIEMAKTFESLIVGQFNNVKYLMIPRFLIRLIEEDIAIMANWIERVGYGANLSLLKKLAKEHGIRTTSLESWLRREEHNKNQKDISFPKGSKSFLNLLNETNAY